MNHPFKRVFIIVLDSLGIGNGKDATLYQDENSNTLKHIDEKFPLKIPNLRSLGLDRICDISPIKVPLDHAYALKMNEASCGKDTLTGHYEIMGLLVTEPFKTFTENGFPNELIETLEKKWNRKIIGNCAASGTQIIKDLGEKQLKTKAAIVYTSSDSVLQIAAHEEIIPLKELYHMCEIAREITKDEKYKLGRIIARPFIGTDSTNFKRTSNRHDYALKPFAPTMLNHLKDAHYDVISIGKIADIFDQEGITESIKIKNNTDGCQKILQTMDKEFTGLCFANLVDFDMEYGHRRDPIGYGKAIEEFDTYLGKMKQILKNDDLLMICADHGNDPTFKGTDHTREQVPLLVYSKSFTQTGILNEVNSFATVSSTIADIFKVTKTNLGESIIDYLK